MKTFASRAAFAGFALILTAGPALAAGLGAAPTGAPNPLASSSPAPPTQIATPQPALGGATISDACANDVFLSYRTVPDPIEHDVTICGQVADAGAGTPPLGRGAVRPSFWVVVDGSTPIAVVASGAAGAAARAGDMAIVRGRYHRENGGGEAVDAVHTATGRGAAPDGYAMLNGTTYR